MTQSTKVLAALKRAANYSKLALHNVGPRSYKRGQGALMKVAYKFGTAKKGISVKKLCSVLGWGRRETMAVAKKAAENGYVTVERKASGKRRVKLTDLGNEILQKRFAAEDRAADEVLGYLTDAERDQLLTLCNKVCDACEEMGIDYSEIKLKKGGRGRKRVRRHEHAHRIVEHGKEGEIPVADETATKVEGEGAVSAEPEACEPHRGFHGFHKGHGHHGEAGREAALETQVTPVGAVPIAPAAPAAAAPAPDATEN